MRPATIPQHLASRSNSHLRVQQWTPSTGAHKVVASVTVTPYMILTAVAALSVLGVTANLLWLALH